MNKIDKNPFRSAKRSDSGFVQVTVIVFMLLAILAIIGLGYMYYNQQEERYAVMSTEVDEMKLRLLTIEKITESLGKKVNLTIPSVQKIDTVFLVSKLKTEAYLTGVKITGLMINSSSLEHNDARFRVTIGNISREFAVSKIAPGGSRKFTVEVPDVPFENATEAEIKSLASSVAYFID